MTGALEVVRAFLNTWELPNDTRTAEDHLPALAADAARWREALPGVPSPAPTDVDALRSLRDDLRGALGTPHPTSLRPRLDALRLRPEVVQPPAPDHPGGLGDGGGPALRFVPDPPSAEGVLLAVVAEAVRDGTWWRLRACPDCGWAFYDSSRNGRRTWCSMTAGPGARGCGSIAKTRAYRARRRAAG